jgi:hypothetical protein
MKGELSNQDERRRAIAEYILALRAIIEQLRAALDEATMKKWPQ